MHWWEVREQLARYRDDLEIWLINRAPRRMIWRALVRASSAVRGDEDMNRVAFMVVYHRYYEGEGR